MSKLNCSLSKQSGITVGEKFELACQGPMGALQTDSLEIKDAQLSDEIPALTLLEVTSAHSEGVDLVVTSYRTGDHSLNQVVLYDGKSKLDLDGANWTVQSVLSQDPMNPPQPIPKFEMVGLSYPVWAWIALAIILAALILIPYRNYKRIQKDKKSFDDLKNLDTAQSPIDSFYRALRKLDKSLNAGSISPKEFVIRLDKEFRIYISRTMQFPAHIFAIPRILKFIKARYPKVYRDEGESIKKYFAELSKLSGLENIEPKDSKFFVNRIQTLIETLNKAQQTKRGTR